MVNWTEKASALMKLPLVEKCIHQEFWSQVTETQLQLAPARDTFISSCNLKSRECAILRHSQILVVSNFIWILNFFFNLSCLPSSIPTCFSSRCSPHDGEHGSGLVGLFFNYGPRVRERLCLNSLGESPKISSVWVTCLQAEARETRQWAGPVI